MIDIGVCNLGIGGVPFRFNAIPLFAPGCCLRLPLDWLAWVREPEDILERRLGTLPPTVLKLVLGGVLVGVGVDTERGDCAGA